MGGGGGEGGACVVYGHWLYSRMFFFNFGSVFQFACPPLQSPIHACASAVGFYIVYWNATLQHRNCDATDCCMHLTRVLIILEQGGGGGIRCFIPMHEYFAVFFYKLYTGYFSLLGLQTKIRRLARATLLLSNYSSALTWIRP